MKLSQFNLNLNACWQICFLFCLSALLIAMPDFALATGSTTDDGISQTLCLVVSKLTGPIGRGIATIAIVVLGIGLFLGKLSWGLAVAVALGIGMIFGAPIMVNWLSGTAGSCSTTY